MTLTALLSTWILQENNPTIKMSELLEKAGMIYAYLQEKPWVKTYMTVKPMKMLSERVIEGLGFK